MLGFGRKRIDDNGHRRPGPFGPYYLHELINSGGMADIWLATDAAQKQCAVRCLRRVDFKARRRFIRGCEILAQIKKHEFIIGYLDHGKIDGCHYLATEYVEGANLKLLMASNDPILSEFAGNILIDMAVGLEHVHESGYMHLDFKPENVMISRNANVRLIDFDLAMPRPQAARKLRDNPGTPAYMSPEQLQRRPVDHRADIFAFGVTAYEFLTFQKPFPGETPAEVLARQLDRSNGFRNPSELNSTIPPVLERIVLKCLETDPDKRYPYMSVVVRELESALYV
ncbi:MAG: serine/threonine protein kinase [Verrucomicrobiae bacterium]|nr:serine/threonine protein kinase [Verrucomicrobiae bacterium]